MFWNEWLWEELFRGYIPPVWEVWIWEAQMAIAFVLSIHNFIMIRKLRKRGQSLGETAK